MSGVLVGGGSWRCLAVAGFVVMLAGCGGDDDGSASSSTTSSAVVSSTTASTTTTTEAPSEEDEIREVVMAWSTLLQDLGDPPSTDAPAFEVLADPLRSRIAQDLPAMQAAGLHFEGSADVRIEEVRIDGDVAFVPTCDRSAVYRFDSDGRNVSEDQSVSGPNRIEYRVERLDGEWRLADFTVWEDQRCEL